MPWLIKSRNSLPCTVRALRKGRAIKGLVVCWMLLNQISLGVRALHPIQVDDDLASLDDHLKIEGELFILKYKSVRASFGFSEIFVLLIFLKMPC